MVEAAIGLLPLLAMLTFSLDTLFFFFQKSILTQNTSSYARTLAERLPRNMGTSSVMDAANSEQFKAQVLANMRRLPLVGESYGPNACSPAVSNTGATKFSRLEVVGRAAPLCIFCKFYDDEEYLISKAYTIVETGKRVC